MNDLNQIVKVVIVDDEKGARETLHNLIELYCQDVDILGEADSIDTAIPLIWKTNPDILFLDIEMPHGSGFDVVEKLKDTTAHIIFTTAYSKYALQAIKASAFDYLLKPIDVSELKQSINKVKISLLKKSATDFNTIQYKSDNEEDRKIKKIAIPFSEGYEIINTDEILFCEGNRNYTSFYLENKKIIVASKTLKEYEIMLSSPNFARVHQKYLVNLDYVKTYIKGRGGTLVLADGKQISVSQNKKAELNKLLLKYLH